MGSGENSISSRQHNRGLVLQMITTGVCASRIELAKATGLTKMTVSNIVSELMERGIVEESVEMQTEQRGRNPINLQLSSHAPMIIGLLIFRDRVEAVLCTMKLKIIKRSCVKFEIMTSQELLDYIFRIIDSVKEGQKESDIMGIGIASIGPIDLISGKILSPPRFYGIENIPILDILKKRYKCPVVIDFENNCAALAEKLYGSGKKAEDFIFLGVSNGIGSGIISGGEVYHSKNGLASEIGHMSIRGDGKQCACGNKGCLEAYASVYVVRDKMIAATGENMSFQEFCNAADRPEIDRIFEEMVHDIGIALVSIANILQPELIVMGHESVNMGSKYIKELERIVNATKVVHGDHKIHVKKAHFGQDAQLLGGAATLLSLAFHGDLLF